MANLTKQSSRGSSQKSALDFENLSLFAGTAGLSAAEPVRAQPEPAVTKTPHWTVSQLTSQIRGVVEPSFTQVWVQGEVSNYRPASSGHAYFSLKDQNASISVAVFNYGSYGARKRTFDLKDGLQLLCRGKVSLYPPRGTYQLVVDHLEPLGAGALADCF